MTERTPDSPQVARHESALNRRRVLKVAVATAPFIATLPSGAALARSSNVISATSEANALDAMGRTQCLDLRSGADFTGSTLDLAEPPSGVVTAITERDYRIEPKGSGAAVSEAEMCKAGGSFYYQESGWKTASVPRGMLVSATALSSFAGGIFYTEV
jgi:hypothetical protein